MAKFEGVAPAGPSSGLRQRRGRFRRDHYNEVQAKLTDVFGGLTAYTRAPAEGLWHRGGTVKRDDIVEVMAQLLDRAFWADYRA
jgi:hypothetical protein